VILVQGRLLLAAVLQLGTADALVLVGERRIIRAGGIRHLSIASPKAAEPSPDNAHLVSSVMRLVSVIKLPEYIANSLLQLLKYNFAIILLRSSDYSFC